MPEERGGGAESQLVTFPSPLRIRQQLGHVSTNQKFKRELVPSLERFGGRAMPVGEFVVSLEARLADYAEKHLHGISALALESMPAIIDSLVTDEPQRTIALEIWEERVSERREADAKNERELRQRRERAARIKQQFLAPDEDLQGLPRRQKKKEKKRREAERRRNAITIDPDRLASNPNSRRRKKRH